MTKHFSTQFESELKPIFEAICQREPIFHTKTFGDFAAAMAPDYWEVGASGRRYGREFILAHLDANPPVDALSAGWHTYGHGLRRLAEDTYLFTYTLRQGERLSRRATIWQTTPDGWRILYHQGTVAGAEEDDTSPA